MKFDARNFAAFVAYIETHGSTVHAWHDRRDCANFSLGGAEAISGMDGMAGLSWSTVRQAWRVCRAEGGLEAAMDKRYNRVAPALALRGDIAGVEDQRWGLHLMLVEGATLVGPGASGLVRVPRSKMVTAWDAMSLMEPVA